MRDRLLCMGGAPMHQLHAQAVRYVCAGAQSIAYEALEGELSEEEAQILRRGRNASAIRTPKHSSMIDYRRATGVEALLGYLYLKGEDGRLSELAEKIFAAIEQREDGGERMTEVCAR